MMKIYVKKLFNKFLCNFIWVEKIKNLQQFFMKIQNFPTNFKNFCENSIFKIFNQFSKFTDEILHKNFE